MGRFVAFITIVLYGCLCFVSVRPASRLDVTISSCFIVIDVAGPKGFDFIVLLSLVPSHSIGIGYS